MFNVSLLFEGMKQVFIFSFALHVLLTIKSRLLSFFHSKASNASCQMSLSNQISNFDLQAFANSPALDLCRSGEGPLSPGIRESCVILPRGRTGAEKEPTWRLIGVNAIKRLAVPIIAQITAVDQQVRSSVISTRNLEIPNWCESRFASRKINPTQRDASGLIYVHYAIKGKEGDEKGIDTDNGN